MTDKTGTIVTTKAVNGNEDVMVITKAGILIRTYLGEVKVAGRNTQGVKIINVKDKEEVVAFTIVPHEETDSSIPSESVNEEIGNDEKSTVNENEAIEEVKVEE